MIKAFVVAEGKAEPDSQFLSRTGAVPIISEAQIAAAAAAQADDAGLSTRIQIDEAAALQPGTHQPQPRDLGAGHHPHPHLPRDETTAQTGARP